MNHRNVDSLRQLLSAPDAPTTDLLAEYLASKGVLVPESLSDSEVDALKTCGYFLNGEQHEPGDPAVLRWALRHIAQGEPVPWSGEDHPVFLHDATEAEIRTWIEQSGRGVPS